MNPSYFTGWFLFRLFFGIYFRLKAFNVERVPRTGPVILASNHASYFDPPMIGSALHRPIAYLARASLFRFPVGPVIRSWHAFPVDRESGRGGGLRTILDRLLEGWPIILFPEGTRSYDGKLRPPESGIGLIIIKSEAPVVPVRVFGSFEAYGRHMLLPRPRKVLIKFGEPMDFRELREEAKTASKSRVKELYRLASEEIMRAIAKLEPCETVSHF